MLFEKEHSESSHSVELNQDTEFSANGMLPSE